MRGRRLLTLSGVIIFWVLLFVFTRIQGAFFAWFLFYFMTAVLLYEAAVAWYGLRHVDVERELSADRLSAGQKLEIKVTLRRSGWWPHFWVRIRDDLPERWLHDESDAERVLLPLWQKTRTFVYDIRNLQRGVYRIGETTLETGDVLGLVRSVRHYQRTNEVLVYPRVVPVRGWSGYHPEELGLRQPTRRRAEESTTVLGVREYIPGDRLSRIHWPASARRGQLQAKEFELHVTSELLFIIDAARSSFPTGSRERFELEMTIAASLMRHAFDLRRQFAMTMHGSRVVSLPAGNTQALLFRALQELAMAEPDGRTDFAQSFARIAQEAPQGTTLVVISPAVTRDTAAVAGTVRNRVTVEWFMPVGGPKLTETERQGLQMLTTAGVHVYLIPSSDQLESLQRGGIQRATSV